MAKLFQNEYLIKYHTCLCKASLQLTCRLSKILSVDVHGENEEGTIFYHCRVGSLNKKTTFEEMHPFSNEMGEPEMTRMLKGLHWLLELNSLERAKMYIHPVSFISKNENFCLFAILLYSSIILILLIFRDGIKAP